MKRKNKKQLKPGQTIKENDFETLKSAWDFVWSMKNKEEKKQWHLEDNLQQMALKFKHEKLCGKEKCDNEHLEWDEHKF